MPIKQAFISYTHSDRDYAFKVKGIIESEGVKAWIDIQGIAAGEIISRQIEEALSNANYYVIVLTRKAVESHWVQRELAIAFDLSRSGRLALIPTVFESVALPLELRGLLHIDFSKDFGAGANQLVSFFRNEAQRAIHFVAPSVTPAPGCESRLAGLDVPDLRHEIGSRLDKSELGVVWFDTFGKKMDDEINPVSTGIISTEMIDRAQKRRIMDKLLKYVCRLRSDLASP